MTASRPLEDIARDVDATRAHLEQLAGELETAERTLQERIALLEGQGVPQHVAVLRALGGRASSAQIAAVVHGETPTRGQVVSVGRRMRGLETSGYLRRAGTDWLVTETDA